MDDVRIPRTGVENTAAFLREGYTFIGKRCRRLDTDVFATRLMMRRVYCAYGEDAARMFYTPDRFTRKGAVPPTALALLQDRGSVQTRDGHQHRARKFMFMSLMSPERIGAFIYLFDATWERHAANWQRSGRVVLHDAVEAVLCRTVWEWCGLPFLDEDFGARTRELAAMIEGAGAVGPRNWRGMALRQRSELRCRRIIRAIRDGSLAVPAGSPADVIANFVDVDGHRLTDKIAAVELINLLRPTIAIARYITFSALALHVHREARDWLASVEPRLVRAFVQEVRRFYPFFPGVGGIAIQEFTWRDHIFPVGSWVLLDLYGTLHDARIWGDPHAFRPERFLGRATTPYDLIPQGGGAHHDGHRCAGEWMTIAATERAVVWLAERMTYNVPAQDLSISLSRMPAIPASRFVIDHVRIH
jgi:fatty-acid peroxygenase